MSMATGLIVKGPTPEWRAASGGCDGGPEAACVWEVGA